MRARVQVHAANRDSHSTTHIDNDIAAPAGGCTGTYHFALGHATQDHTDGQREPSRGLTWRRESPRAVVAPAVARAAWEFSRGAAGNRAAGGRGCMRHDELVPRS